MNAVRCVACVFFVICILDVTRGRDFNEILDSLPSDLGRVITSAWRGVLKAIKTPMRPRRLRKGKKKMMTTVAAAAEPSEAMLTLLEVVSTKAPRRPTIPILTQPEWRSLLDWRILQKPNIVKLAREYHNKGPTSVYGRSIDPYEVTTLKQITNEEEVFEYNTIFKKDSNGQRERIDIPVIPTPEYKYEYLWRAKFRSRYVKDSRTTRSSIKAVTDYSTLTSFSSQTRTVTEKALLKEMKFGKYRLNIFYKFSFQ